MRSPIHGRAEGREKGAACILDALSARNAAADLHQGNHADTSYGTSLYTRVHVRIKMGEVRIDSSMEPLSIRLRALSRGVRAKITTGKLGGCLRETGPGICQVEEEQAGISDDGAGMDAGKAGDRV